MFESILDDREPFGSENPAATDPARHVRARYDQVRRLSERIAEPLSPEDCSVQSMPDVSPTRWHLAHTTWFFETFLLKKSHGYQVFDASFESLFNSYYNSIGQQYPRSSRGWISRPGLAEVLDYRHHVDQAMAIWIESPERTAEQMETLWIGLHHEQQHQELMLTDIKHVLSCNPLDPVYRNDISDTEEPPESVDQSWIELDEQLVWIGTDTASFAFDNERPRHRSFLDAYRIANRCVNNREYLAFIEDGGYQRPEFWLSLGWATVQAQNWTMPLYWARSGDQWSQFTLYGRRPINEREPVCHLSYFEADAYARWAGCRLPTEQEWEHAVQSLVDDSTGPPAEPGSDRALDCRRSIHPQAPSCDSNREHLIDALGTVWQWTASQYNAYPGYDPPGGALGEYNGKFMCNQFVLRGGSCATPSGHLRTTYRNFFPPEARWQFTGVRLAQ